MNRRNISAVGYQYDEIFPTHSLDLSFDRESIEDPIFDYPFLEIIPSAGSNLPKDSFTTAQIEAPIINEDARARKSRIRDKVRKAKTKCLMQRKTIRKQSGSTEKLSLVARNRLSAQRSREKKKEELDRLKQANEKLEKSKQEIEGKFALVNAELESMKATLELLSPESREEFNSIHERRNTSSGKTGKHSAPVLLAGALFCCICVACCIIPFMSTGESYLPAPTLNDENYFRPYEMPSGTMKTESIGTFAHKNMLRYETYKEEGHIDRNHEGTYSSEHLEMVESEFTESEFTESESSSLLSNRSAELWFENKEIVKNFYLYNVNSTFS